MCSEKLDLMSQDYARQRKIRAAKNRAMKKWFFRLVWSICTSLLYGEKKQ